jgi:hypothetical protein
MGKVPSLAVYKNTFGEKEKVFFLFYFHAIAHLALDAPMSRS